MLPPLLIAIPVVLAGVALLVRSNRLRPWTLPAAAVGHLTTTGMALNGATPPPGELLALDALGRLVLLVISVVFCLASFYAVGYLRHRDDKNNRVFTACLLLLLGIMTVVVSARNLALMWVAIEATALATAPLIYFNRTERSIEATWKYLLIGSVGVAMALLGTFFLAYAALPGGFADSLQYDALLAAAPHLSRPWLRAAFVLLLIGYGTKMGLAPMHTWKPDAYGEAPGVVGTVLAGAVTSCAFLALLRVFHIVAAAGEKEFAASLMVGMGLFSMAIAGVFMLGQRDFKRMLAYSSVEHMGILIFGVGLGGVALYGALLHLVNNAAAKGTLFLTAANIHRAYDDKTVDRVFGAARRVPWSAWLFFAGFVAVTGSPPFGPFVSEFTILGGAFADQRYWLGGGFLTLLFLVFLGMGATTLTMVQGAPAGAAPPTRYRDAPWSVLPPLLFLALATVNGLHLPAVVARVVNDATAYLEVCR